MIKKININKKFTLFNDYWSPKIIGNLNDSYIKIAKIKGEFVWHKHKNEGELFFVVKGNLLIKLKDQDIHLKKGEMVVIPKGVERLPIAKKDVQIIMIEPKTTLNTGNVINNLTKKNLKNI